jgi:hypothetical protein
MESNAHGIRQWATAAHQWERWGAGRREISPAFLKWRRAVGISRCAYRAAGNNWLAYLSTKSEKRVEANLEPIYRRRVLSMKLITRQCTCRSAN